MHSMRPRCSTFAIETYKNTNCNIDTLLRIAEIVLKSGSHLWNDFIILPSIHVSGKANYHPHPQPSHTYIHTHTLPNDPAV